MGEKILRSTPAFAAVKFETPDVAACEAFFTGVFGFAVTHRYGGVGEAFTEIVMEPPGGGPMLKFIQAGADPCAATGATIQIRSDAIDPLIAAAIAAGASLTMAATSYPEAGVRMAVVTTDQGLAIELVQEL